MSIQCLTLRLEDKHYQTNRTEHNISKHIGNHLAKPGILTFNVLNQSISSWWYVIDSFAFLRK